ncbi:MAG: universal stress protein [Hyphomonadaceae bacterium]
MAYRSITLTATGMGGDAAAIEAAALLAKHCGAEIKVIPAFPDIAANYVAYGFALGAGAESAALSAISDAEHEAQAQLEALAANAAAQTGVRISVETRALLPAAALARASVLADLAVFGAHSIHESPMCADLFSETLLVTRAVTLLMGAGAPAPRAVAIAWDASAQAGRAVRAALPLLKAAERIVILTNTDDENIQDAGAAPLTAYLALHGAPAASVHTVHGDTVAQSLLDAAARECCDLIVAGAYGRPRLYEWALGGTTRTLVQAENAPHRLLAH